MYKGSLYKWWNEIFDLDNADNETLEALQNTMLKGAAMITDIVIKRYIKEELDKKEN